MGGRRSTTAANSKIEDRLLTPVVTGMAFNLGVVQKQSPTIVLRSAQKEATSRERTRMNYGNGNL